MNKIKSLPSLRLYLRSRNTIRKYRPWWFVISSMDKSGVGFKGIVTVGMSRKCSLTRVISELGPDGNEEYFTGVSRRR